MQRAGKLDGSEPTRFPYGMNASCRIVHFNALTPVVRERLTRSLSGLGQPAPLLSIPLYRFSGGLGWLIFGCGAVAFLCWRPMEKPLLDRGDCLMLLIASCVVATSALHLLRCRRLRAELP